MRHLPLAVRALRDPDSLAALDLAGWELLLSQAASAMLQARLYYLLEARGLLAAVPAPAREHLLWARAVAERHDQAVAWEVAQIGAALAGLDLPLVYLKGAAYAVAQLPVARGRLFSDIDILVPEARLGEVEAALMLRGWAMMGLDSYDERYYRQWMHELPPMQHIARATTIDIHHAILPRTAPLHPDPVQLREAAVPAPGAPGARVLAPADMVLHSATHLFFDGELDHGLRDLSDLHGLLQAFGGDPGFWPALAARARALQLSRPLFYALRYGERLLGLQVPAAAAPALTAGRPNRLLLALMDTLFERALLPVHPSCDRAGTGLARFLIYLRGNWLRMPPLLLARHLFHKAFLSPSKEPPAADTVPAQETGKWQR